ncbi:hypothetical protein [Methanobrevibacter sp.]|uniref:hypothetical protein n=1 Tax=Methanobrevibacter sp. TaxID=66852 RepID=UPI003863D252
MKIIVKNIDDMDKPISSGTLYFESNGGHVTISLLVGHTVFIDHETNRVFMNDYPFKDHFPHGLCTEEVIINIDGWFHVFHELVMNTDSLNITRIQVIPHQEDSE